MLRRGTTLCMALVGLLAGCDDSPSLPTEASAPERLPVREQPATTGAQARAAAAVACASAEALSVATEALWVTAGKQAADDAERAKLEQAKSGFMVKFEDARLVHRDEGSGRERCAAELVVSLTDAAKQTVPKEFKQSVSAEVSLTSQATADGKRLVVELSGHEQPAEFVRSLASMGALDGLLRKP